MTIRFALSLLIVSALPCQHSSADEALKREAVMGKLMAQQFRDSKGTIEIPEAKAYLERVVGELAAAQPGDGPCCTIALYARAEAPAKPVAYPGGYLFVPAKLFFTSKDESAFVHALAHAVAHIRQRDWVSSGAANYGSTPLDYIGAADDRPESLPLEMRKQFEAREQLADEAADNSAPAVKIGTGEFERIRDHAPLPTPRPSLQP